MKVVLINHSDARGGASVATFRLMEALRGAGCDARMLVGEKLTESPFVHVVGSKLRRKACFLMEHAEIFARNGFSRANLFQASIATCGLSLADDPLVRAADIVVLGWVNQGMLSLAEIGRIKAPVVWVMHDMWPFTGVCHHAGTCNRYLRDCGFCRLLHGGRCEHDLSRSTWQRKSRLYSAKPMAFVAVSRWLADCARRSSLLRGGDVSVIHNPFPVDTYRRVPDLPLAVVGIPEGCRLIVMGAARLDDPVKGLPLAVAALNGARERHPAAMRGAHAVFFGALRDAHALDGLKLPHTHIGPVAAPVRLAALYAAADAVLSTSHYESFGLTLVEGLAAGAVPVAYDHGGQSDIIEPLTATGDGFLVPYPCGEDPDIAPMADAIAAAMLAPQTAEARAARAASAERFAPQRIADSFIALFKRLLQK